MALTDTVSRVRDAHTLPALIEDGGNINNRLMNLAERVTRVANQLGIGQPKGPEAGGAAKPVAIDMGLHAIAANHRTMSKHLDAITEELDAIENAVS